MRSREMHSSGTFGGTRLSGVATANMWATRPYPDYCKTRRLVGDLQDTFSTVGNEASRSNPSLR